MARKISKSETLITIYEKLYDSDEFNMVKIRSKECSSDYYKQWLEFSNELEKLGFEYINGEWELHGNTNIVNLKKELINRGFNVKIASLLD